MKKIAEIFELVGRKCPLSAAMDWDNPGLLVGDPGWETDRVHIALDADDLAVEHAIQNQAGLLLTHHPLIFGKIRRVCADDFLGRRIIRLIEKHVAVISMHTNFDVYGMAEAAAERMGLSVIGPLEETEERAGEAQGIGRVGLLQHSQPLQELARKVKEDFGISSVRFFGDGETIIQKVALCPGSGRSMISLALEKGAQALITGDIDHHSGIDAVAQGLCVVDAGHYGIEHIFMDVMQDYLETAAEGEISVTVDPFREPFVTV